MAETSLPRRPRQITGRLRIALLVCAAAAAAIPVIVWLTTASVMERQDDLSDRLISSVARSAELNAALIRLADDTGRLGRLDAPGDVETASAIALARLRSLRTGFAEEFAKTPDRSEAQDIAALLSEYEVIVADVGDNRIAQLQALESLAARRADIQRLLRDTNARLLSTIATTGGRVEQRMYEASGSAAAATDAGLFTDFQNLTLYSAITQLLDTVQERVADIDPSAPPRNADGVAAKLRFLMRGLATRVAKIKDGPLRQSLARDIQALDRALQGQQSIVVDYQKYQNDRESGAALAQEQSRVAAALLDKSDATIATSKEDALLGSKEIADLVRDNRIAVLGLSSLLLMTLFSLLFYFVGRKFSRRIGTLTDGVLAIADGDTDHRIDIGGNDELTAMSDALHVFRENRHELEVRNREVREAGTRLQTILDTTTSGIIAFDRAGDVLLVNLPGRDFLGGISDATPFALPDTIRFLDSEDLSPLEASSNPIMRALAGQNLKSEIALMRRAADDEARYMRISSATVTDDSSPVRCVVVFEDVSEAEKNRQQIERAGRLDALGQLTGGIAHDFNNLLATIEYALELSLATGVNAKAEDYLRTAVGSVRRGSDLTARLLSFAKQQPGRARSQKASDIMREFRALIEPSLEQALTLNFVEDAPDLYVLCDGGQLENALLNLVLNSRDAILRSGQGDRITVSVRAVTETAATVVPANETDHRGVAATAPSIRKPQGTMRYVDFSVTDNGPGMSAEVRRRALDPFFTTKDANSGTGLGLSMVYGFVQNADGALRLYSEEGHGTTVRLLLPGGTAETAQGDAMADPAVQAGHGERILVVEDDEQLREIAAELVGSLGYSVEVARSGREALARFEAGDRFDALLTDIVMPGGMGGFALGEAVRAIHPTLPIIYMSGYTRITEAEMGTAIGGFVQKPCTPSDLSNAIASAMG